MQKDKKNSKKKKFYTQDTNSYERDENQYSYEERAHKNSKEFMLMTIYKLERELVEFDGEEAKLTLKVS